MSMKTQKEVGIHKSSQDLLGRVLSAWRNKVVLREVKKPLLDIACGDNRIAFTIPGSFGIDIENYGRADIIVQNFENIPIKSHGIPCVTIVGSLNYFDDPVAVLKECHRILKPGGILVVTMLNPKVGKLWHMFREPWAKFPGFSVKQIFNFAQVADYKIELTKRFMIGLNNLFILRKPI